MTLSSSPFRLLTGNEKNVLCALADPCACCPSVSAINNCDPVTLFGALAHHGVEPVALRKLKSVSSELDNAFASHFDAIVERQFIATALTMALENYTDEIFSQMADTNCRGVTVKGSVFARQLYAHQCDRPFTDVDILVPCDGLESFGIVLQKLGYRQIIKKIFDKSEANMEQKWVREDTANVLVEIHTNLVHYTNLRRRLSFGYTEYMLASQQGQFPAAANFLTAVVHAAAGHKFNELKLLVDVAQAFRQLQAGDIACLEKILDVIPARLEVLTCLDLICVLFENLVVDDVIAQLAGQTQFRVTRKLVTTDAVLNTYFDRWHVSRLRRHSFRFLQNRLKR